jgi:hypothetical protein
MISIKSRRIDPDVAELEVLLATKLLATARRLPSGRERDDILKEIGKFVVRAAALKAKRKLVLR